MKLSDLPKYLQGRFGLLAFPGSTFVVNIDACYDDKIYTAIIKDGKQMDFAKCTLAELAGQVTWTAPLAGLTQQQRYNCAASLSMGTKQNSLANLRRIEVDEVTYKAAEQFLSEIEPLFPVPRDGFIPKSVMAIVNGK
jgi:hypothetical protein